MVTPAKHPSAPSRLREGESKALLAFEGGLKPLDMEVPQVLIEDEQGAETVWEREIVPLIQRGILKQTDYTSCVHYCQLAVVPIMRLPGTKLTYLNRLKTELGLTPKARTNLASSSDASGEPRLSEIMRSWGEE